MSLVCVKVFCSRVGFFSSYILQANRKEVTYFLEQSRRTASFGGFFQFFLFSKCFFEVLISIWGSTPSRYFSWRGLGGLIFELILKFFCRCALCKWTVKLYIYMFFFFKLTEGCYKKKYEWTELELLKSDHVK